MSSFSSFLVFDIWNLVKFGIWEDDSAYNVMLHLDGIKLTEFEGRSLPLSWFKVPIFVAFVYGAKL